MSFLRRGIYFQDVSRFFFFFRFWLLGFLAFRRRFGFCGFSLVYAALGGFGFSHPLLFEFLSGLSGFCTLSVVFGFGFPHPQHHQFLPV